MKLKFYLGTASKWPIDRLMRMHWFPLLSTYRLRTNWLYDLCRIAGTRNLQMIFDVGANIGQTAKDISGYFPKARIHSFEPVNDTFLILGKNLRRLPNVHAHKLAMGRQSKFLNIELQGSSLFNSLSHVPGASVGGARVERIEVTTLDEFCAAQHIDTIDVLKTYAQGCDVDVLAGGDKLISNGRVPFIYSEVSFQPDDKTNTHFLDLNEHLLSRRFRLFGFYDQWGGVDGGRGCLQFCNALYINPEALSERFRPVDSLPSR